MYKFKAYLKHLITATDQHGVHSPFVFEFVTNCLYKKSPFRVPKSHEVLLKIIPFFSIEQLKIVSKDSKIKKLVQKQFGLNTNEKGALDLIYQDIPRRNLLSTHQKNIHNDTVILIENIHKNKGATYIWKALKQDGTVTVSIDMFYCGLLFFRKEQVKEHFKIRI